MNQDQIPAWWKYLLKQIQTASPGAIMAGGCLRDLDNGREIKDLDVFINTGIEPVIEAVKPFWMQIHHCDGSYIDAAQEVAGSYTFLHDPFPTPNLNIVQLRSDFDTAGVINRMDFGICQLGFDGTQVLIGPDYHTDKAGQRFTLTRAETPLGIQRSVKRYERLSKKYQGWPLVGLPTELEAA